MKTKARNWLVGAGVLGVGVAAVAVYSGALQWIADERTLTVGAGESAVRAPDLPPALTASRSMPEPEPISAIRAGASDQEQLASQRTAVTGGAQPLSQEELRQMLFSSRRLDQVRAIELLLQAHTLEAAQTLLNGLLTSTDPVLLALLEEALLKSPLDVSPAVEAAFTTSNDPQKLEVLAHLLTQLVAKRPELESKVVGIFMGALKDLASNAPRADAASKELVALGIRATDQLGAYLADRETGPEGAGKAAWVLAQLSGEYRDVLRKKLRDGFEATLHALSDRGLSDADKDRIRKKTGSLAWASTLRSGTEHDVLAEVLVDSLTRTTDEAQAGTLGWGLANLKGLTDEGKLRATRALLSSLVGQANSGIAHSYVRAVSQLATGSSRSLEFVRLVEEALSSYGSNPQVTTQLRWLQTQLSPK